MPGKIYETTSEKRKDFWRGFIGWFGLNIVMALIGVGVSLWIAPNLSAQDFNTTATIYNYLSIGLSCLPLLINVGLIVIFAFTRSQIAMGMLTAFGVALFISICLGIIATVACFVMLGQTNP